MEQVRKGTKKILEDEGLLVLNKTELVRNILENNSNLTRICMEKYGRHVELKFAEVVPRRPSSKQLSCKYAAN